MKFRYFISYSFIENNVPLFGHAQIETESLITDFNDIKRLVKGMAEEYKQEKIVILNFKLLRRIKEAKTKWNLKQNKY